MNPNRQSTTVPTEGWFRFLPAEGLEPVLVSHEPGAFHEWALSQQIPAYHVTMPLPSGFSWPQLVKALWRLTRIVRRHRVQLIHSNEQDLYPVAQYLHRVTGIPAVTSVHFTMDRGYCEWAFGGSRAPARIFFVSEGNLEACRPGLDGVVARDRWHVLPNGLDLEHFKPDDTLRRTFRSQHGISENVVVGVACALRPRKQLEHLFEAASRVADPNLRILVAGAAVAGDESYAERLLKDGKELLGNRLLVLGHLDELRGFYNGLDVFVNTSQEEACSISVIESLACGCPVLGYASKSVDGQILPDGGEIVPQDDVESLATSLWGWVADETMRLSGRAGARHTAEDRFAIRAMCQDLWRQYKAIAQI